MFVLNTVDVSKKLSIQIKPTVGAIRRIGNADSQSEIPEISLRSLCAHVRLI